MARATFLMIALTGLVLTSGCVPPDLSEELPTTGDMDTTSPDMVEVTPDMDTSGDPDLASNNTTEEMGGGDDPAVQRGLELFMSTGCVGCHNADGTPNPTSGNKPLSETANNFSTAEITTILNDGIEGTIMQGYSDRLSAMEIADLVAFIESLNASN